MSPTPLLRTLIDDRQCVPKLDHGAPSGTRTEGSSKPAPKLRALPSGNRPRRKGPGRVGRVCVHVARRRVSSATHQLTPRVGHQWALCHGLGAAGERSFVSTALGVRSELASDAVVDLVRLPDRAVGVRHPPASSMSAVDVRTSPAGVTVLDCVRGTWCSSQGPRRLRGALSRPGGLDLFGGEQALKVSPLAVERSEHLDASGFEVGLDFDAEVMSQGDAQQVHAVGQRATEPGLRTTVCLVEVGAARQLLDYGVPDSERPVEGRGGFENILGQGHLRLRIFLCPGLFGGVKDCRLDSVAAFGCSDCVSGGDPVSASRGVQAGIELPSGLPCLVLAAFRPLTIGSSFCSRLTRWLSTAPPRVPPAFLRRR